MRYSIVSSITCLLTISSVDGTPLHPLKIRAATPIAGYSYSGCYTEATSGRALSGSTYYDDRMTVEKCAAACKAFSMFGVEYGRECFCGNARNTGSVLAPEGECSFTCPGNKAQTCGAGNRLDIYEKSAGEPSGTTSDTTVATTSAVSTPTSSKFMAKGCYTEATNGRALAGKSYVDDSMTVEVCAATCEGFTYFGLEYYHECYCGYTLRSGSVPADAGDCNTPCTGDKTELCGGGNRLNVYEYSSTSPPVAPSSVPYSSEGCYTEATNSRALTGASNSNDAMSVEFCANYCSGFTYFGVEYGRECFCGNSLQAGSVPTDAGDCSFSCAGNSAEKCGAGNRLNLYKVGGATSTSSSATSLSSSSSTSAVFPTTSSTSDVASSTSASSTPMETSSSTSDMTSSTPMETSSSTSDMTSSTSASSSPMETSSSTSDAASTTSVDSSSSMSSLPSSTSAQTTPTEASTTLLDTSSVVSIVSSVSSAISSIISIDTSIVVSTTSIDTSSSTSVAASTTSTSLSSSSDATSSSTPTSSMSSTTSSSSQITMSSSTPVSSTTSSAPLSTSEISSSSTSTVSTISTTSMSSMSTSSMTSMTSPSSRSTISSVSTTPSSSSSSTSMTSISSSSSASTSMTFISSSSSSSTSMTSISPSSTSTVSSISTTPSSSTSRTSTISTSPSSTSSISSTLSSTSRTSSTSTSPSSTSTISSSTSRTSMTSTSPSSTSSTSSSTSRTSLTSTTSSSITSTTACPSFPAVAIPCDGTTKFTLQSCTAGNPSNVIRAYFGPDSRLQLSTSTSITPAVFVLKQELGACRLSTASVKSPASPNALAEKKSSSVGSDDYLYFLQHTPDVGNSADPLLRCSVSKSGVLSCDLNQDMVFRSCPVSNIDYVFFGPQNPQAGTTCPTIVFNAVTVN